MEQPDEVGARVYCLLYLSGLSPQLCTQPDTRPVLERILAILRARGQERGVAATLTALGNVAWEQSDFAFALSCYEETVLLHRDTRNGYAEAYALLDVGHCHYQLGEYDAARTIYSQGERLFRKLGYRTGLDTACNNLGSALFHLGDSIRARQLHNEALEIYRDTTNVEGIAWSLERLGVVEAFHGEPTMAAHLLGAASSARTEFGGPMTSCDQRDWDSAMTIVRSRLGVAEFDRIYESARTTSVWRLRGCGAKTGKKAPMGPPGGKAEL